MVVIDPEFQALIPSLASGELEQLESNLKAEGCRDPLVQWGEILLDGHNRFAICQRLGIQYRTVSLQFEDRDAAKIWIIRNQLGRRNLVPFIRGELALKMAELSSAAALQKKAAEMRALNDAKTREWVRSESEVAGAILDVLSDQPPKRINASPNKIYVALDAQGERVKIGCSHDPESRVKEDIKRHVPGAKIIRQFYGDLAVESHLHEHLKDFRLNNEWFKWDAATEAEMDRFLDLSNIRQIENSEVIDALGSAAEIAGISRASIQKVRVISSRASETNKEKLRSGETTINREYKRIVQGERKAAQVELVKAAKLPEGKYHVIVADPPWSYGRTDDPTHRGACPYPLMDRHAICAMPVGDLAHTDCILWLWTTNAFMPEAYQVANSWGFEVKTILTWAKDRMGTGDWLRGQTEHCLLAVRGKPVLTLTNQTTLLHGPVREHSRKPDSFYSLVAELCPGTKLEMFSREDRPGWASCGAEVSKFATNAA